MSPERTLMLFITQTMILLIFNFSLPGGCFSPLSLTASGMAVPESWRFGGNDLHQEASWALSVNI